MADDGLLLILGRLEETPALRPAFVASLRAELHRELGFATVTVAPVPTPAPIAVERAFVPVEQAPRRVSIRRFLDSLRPVTPRVALIAILALLLLACTVAGAYFVLRAWLSAGPRGAQYTNDFAFAEVVRQPGVFYSDIDLSADGRTLYALRQPMPSASGAIDQADGVIVRFDLGASPPINPAIAFRLADLNSATYWDAGTNLTGAIVTGSPTGLFPGDQMSIAPNGDLFVGVATERASAESTQFGPGSLIVIHPDGTAQKVITIGELSTAGLLAHPSTQGYVTAVASAPDRLWARAESPIESGATWDLLEIIDPTHDGDWSDRIARRLVLPTTVPQVEYGVYDRTYGAFAAEPSVPGRDRSDSVILPVIERSGEYRVFRIADPDEDGDATDPGEAELLFLGQANPESFLMQSPLVAPRVVVDEGRFIFDELVVARLTLPTRVSRITSSGVLDILRALPTSADAVVAAPDGSIYVATQEAGVVPSEGQESGKPSVYIIDRLTPVPVGATSSAGGQAPAATSGASGGTGASPAASLSVELHPVTTGVARVAVLLQGLKADDSSQALLFGADGSGPEEVLPVPHNHGFCQSADGAFVAYWSDAEVPNEAFLYVARADGTATIKVREKQTDFLCPFPGEAVGILESSGNAAVRIIRHDLSTGAETALIEGVSGDGPIAISPDGRRIVVTDVNGRDLTEVNLVAGTVTRFLASTGEPVRGAWWSPDGRSLAYTVGPRNPTEYEASGPFEVWVVDATGGTPRRILSRESRPPSVKWSPDSRSIAVLWRERGSSDEGYTGMLTIADLVSGRSRDVSENAIYGQWSPVDPATFAFADMQALHIEGPTGSLREIAAPGRWPAAGIFAWMGWSPDGKYIGTASGASRVGVVDVSSGEFRVLTRDDDDWMVICSSWWR